MIIFFQIHLLSFILMILHLQFKESFCEFIYDLSEFALHSRKLFFQFICKLTALDETICEFIYDVCELALHSRNCDFMLITAFCFSFHWMGIVAGVEILAYGLDVKGPNKVANLGRKLQIRREMVFENVQVMCPTCFCTGMAMANENNPRFDPFDWQCYMT